MGPAPRSTVLTPKQEAICVAFRRHTLLALDDCLYALQSSIPGLTRSSLHRCFQRHGISRLPEPKGDQPAKKKFARYPIGYFHIDIAEVHTEEGRLYLFVAVDRTSKFAFAELHDQATRRFAANFLRALLLRIVLRVAAALFAQRCGFDCFHFFQIPTQNAGSVVFGSSSRMRRAAVSRASANVPSVAYAKAWRRAILTRQRYASPCEQTLDTITLASSTTRMKFLSHLLLQRHNILYFLFRRTGWRSFN